MGSFNRRIVVVTRTEGSGGEARAALEDDFHHFRVMVRYESEHVVKIVGSALRNPYTLCQSASHQLSQLVGMRLGPVASSVNRMTDVTEQCTHQLDLSGLALAAGSARRAYRRYDLTVADRVGGRTTAEIRRDDEPLLTWDIQGGAITGPQPFTGVSLAHGLARWALSTLPSDLAEAAIVLRRGAVISMGRTKNLDAQIHARPTGQCFAQQPARAEHAIRIVGSTGDFTLQRDALCETDRDWLAFA